MLRDTKLFPADKSQSIEYGKHQAFDVRSLLKSCVEVLQSLRFEIIACVVEDFASAESVIDEDQSVGSDEFEATLEIGRDAFLIGIDESNFKCVGLAV